MEATKYGLLDSLSLEVKEFAAKEKEPRSELQSVLITPTETFATDTYVLARVKHPEIDYDEFPANNNDNSKPEAFTENILIGVASAAQLQKAIPKKGNNLPLPVLGTAAYFGKDDRAAKFMTTDLSTCNNIDALLVTGQNYLNYEHLFPTEEPVFEINLDADYLIKIAKLIKAAAKEVNNRRAIVRLRFYRDGQPVRFGDDQRVDGLLMPLKINKRQD